jgi:hypothetical protein
VVGFAVDAKDGDGPRAAPSGSSGGEGWAIANPTNSRYTSSDYASTDLGVALPGLPSPAGNGKSGQDPNTRGQAAAALAAGELKAEGYTILGTEVPAFISPILQSRRYDVVAARNGTIYGVEVKSSIVGSFKLDPYQVYFDSVVVKQGVPSAVGVITGVMYRGVCFGCGPGAAFRTAVQLAALKAAGIPTTITNLPPWAQK